MAAATVTTVIRAPRAIVYDVFADKERWSTFLPIQTKLVEAGTPTPQGVGAVHQLGVGPVGVKERITEVVPLERIRYELIAFGPVRGHSGEIIFADEGAATRVTYRMETTPSIPVPRRLLASSLRALIGVMVFGARRAVRRRATG
ncbi:MAG: SRPBCC family protein [Mycobacterium sp.]|nr:SRPBCC family protein [Mycobacterium sp.]